MAQVFICAAFAIGQWLLPKIAGSTQCRDFEAIGGRTSIFLFPLLGRGSSNNFRERETRSWLRFRSSRERFMISLWRMRSAALQYAMRMPFRKGFACDRQD
jgi:hypothetical protein